MKVSFPAMDTRCRELYATLSAYLFCAHMGRQLSRREMVTIKVIREANNGCESSRKILEHVINSYAYADDASVGNLVYAVTYMNDERREHPADLHRVAQDKKDRAAYEQEEHYRQVRHALYDPAGVEDYALRLQSFAASELFAAHDFETRELGHTLVTDQDFAWQRHKEQ